MHRLAGAVASLTAALLAAFFFVEDTRPSGSVVIPVLLAVFVVAAAYYLATTDAARSAWRDRKRGAGLRELGQDCRRLADELDEFLAERTRSRPAVVSGDSEDEEEDEQQQEHRQSLEEYQESAMRRLAEYSASLDRIDEHDQETMRLYEERYAAPVFRAVRGLHEAGLIFGGEARVLPYPTDPERIISVSRQLRQFGRRLGA